QVAVLAHELRLLHRNDPRVERLEPLVARRGGRRDLVLLGGLLGPLRGLLFRQEILDRFHVLQAGFRRDGGLGDLLGRRLEVLQRLLVVDGDLFVFHGIVYVVDVLGHRAHLPLVRWEITSPLRARASYTPDTASQPKGGSRAYGNAREAPRIPAQE